MITSDQLEGYMATQLTDMLEEVISALALFFILPLGLLFFWYFLLCHLFLYSSSSCPLLRHLFFFHFSSLLRVAAAGTKMLQALSNFPCFISSIFYSSSSPMLLVFFIFSSSAWWFLYFFLDSPFFYQCSRLFFFTIFPLFQPKMAD